MEPTNLSGAGAARTTQKPFRANPSDFLQGVTFTDLKGRSQPGDPHGCITGPAALALIAQLGTIGLKAAMTKDFAEPCWPVDAPYKQSAQVPFLDIAMKGQVIHINAAEILELYDGRYETQLADYIVMQRCLRAAG
jgi:hypothetical protein